MQDASNMLPDNVEILIKLSGAIFQYLPQSDENDK